MQKQEEQQFEEDTKQEVREDKIKSTIKAKQNGIESKYNRIGPKLIKYKKLLDDQRKKAWELEGTTKNQKVTYIEKKVTEVLR